MASDTITSIGADELRAQMARELAAYPTPLTPEILDAVRTVPKHLFIPDVALPEAYALGAVVTDRDENGVAPSSDEDLPSVAMMLRQLGVRSGQRVLEIGAGTGYNAALLRQLVGPDGSVTTIDILEQAADETREHLSAAGVADVTVVHGDGELGVTENAPYDRIIVTAGVSDLPPAWAEQLARGGRLVVPLRIKGVTRVITFERHGGYWRSLEIETCGFMPMRGESLRHERILSLRGETGVVVRTDGGEPLEPAALPEALEGPALIAWTGVRAEHGVFPDLDFWLAEEPGFARVIMMGGGVEAGLIPPQHDWGSMGVVRDGVIAYLTTYPTGGTTLEIGVCAYGTAGRLDLLDSVTGRIITWDRAMNGTGQRLWIEVRPTGIESPSAAMASVQSRYNRIFVGHARADEHTS